MPQFLEGVKSFFGGKRPLKITQKIGEKKLMHHVSKNNTEIGLKSNTLPIDRSYICHAVVAVYANATTYFV